MKENFDRKMAIWNVVLSEDKASLYHDGEIEEFFSIEDLGIISTDFAAIIERTVMAMPSNKCSRLTLLALWD